VGVILNLYKLKLNCYFDLLCNCTVVWWSFWQNLLPSLSTLKMLQTLGLTQLDCTVITQKTAVYICIAVITSNHLVLFSWQLFVYMLNAKFC